MNWRPCYHGESMRSKGKKRADVEPMRIAWLLRADLRRGDPVGGPISEWFKIWWLIHGAREYSAWADYSAYDNAGLFQPQKDTPTYGGLGMTAALRFLLDTRKDLANKFDVNTEEGLLDAIAWFYVHGIREHCMVSAIDKNTLAALDDAQPYYVSNNLGEDEAPELTWLMLFVWRTSNDLRNHFNLECSKDRQAYLVWFFFNGVPQLKIEPLIAPRWKTWLSAPVLSNNNGFPVPRAAYLLWKKHSQLQKAFDLRTEQGIAALSLWAKEVWNTQKELAWISQVKTTPVRIERTNSRPFGLNLIGFAFGELGIGEDVRMAVSACEAAGIPFTVVNIHAGENLRQADQELADYITEASDEIDPAPYSFNLFCLTAFDTARVYLERGEGLFKDRYNIGWWPWELPVWPRNWTLAFDLIDEVWAATTFTKKMYSEARKPTGRKYAPVTLMPMPASVKRVKSISREELGLPEKNFLFLYIFDFNSYLARKNPIAAVRAFIQAFDKRDNSVSLVLKTMNSNPENLAWISFIEECSQDDRIIVIDRTMERGEVLGLIQACDAYVSLHRSEGLGRTMAEAMLFGKTVVGTNFSGNADFLNKSTGYPVRWNRVQVHKDEYAFVEPADNPWWADPIIADAVRAMRQARVNQNKIQPEAFANKFFSPERIGTLISARLHLLSENLIRQA